jgi:hypothetical protein
VEESDLDEDGEVRGGGRGKNNSKNGEDEDEDDDDPTTNGLISSPSKLPIDFHNPAKVLAHHMCPAACCQGEFLTALLCQMVSLWGRAGWHRWIGTGALPSARSGSSRVGAAAAAGRASSQGGAGTVLQRSDVWLLAPVPLLL